MDEAEMTRYITETFKGVDMVVADDNKFFFYNPDNGQPPEHMFPFATLMTNDVNDKFSNLDRPSVFRLNIGLGKQTFRDRFGSPKLPSDSDGSPNNEKDIEFDFTAFDRVMPHPVYGRMYWVCILNPSDETFEDEVRPLLGEAYERDVEKHNK